MIQLEFSEDSPFQKGGVGRWAKINPFGSQVSVLPAHTVSSDGTGASFRGCWTRRFSGRSCWPALGPSEAGWAWGPAHPTLYCSTTGPLDGWVICMFT